MISIPFLDRIHFPKLKFNFTFGPASFVGIDIGNDSVKVVQLRKENERAILETYGELKTERYFGGASSGGGGLLARNDKSISNLLADILRESNVTSKQAVIGIPSTSSFITVVNLPLLKDNEIAAAMPFEAKRYIPIPAAEVAIDWQILETDEAERRTSVLLVAVPNEVVAKYKRIAELVGLELVGAEIENFSMVRSLAGSERGVIAMINWGAAVTTVTIVDQRRIRVSHNFGRGSHEITMALAHSMGVSMERAELMKKEVGLSEKPEEKEIAEVIAPFIDNVLSDSERVITVYNRGSKRKVEKIVLVGGGAGLNGLVSYSARHFGLETALINPFARTVFPEFLQPVLKSIAPNFAIAVGLALRPIIAS